MKIALCDDDALELKKAKKSVDEFVVSKPEHSITIDIFSNGSDLLTAINKHGCYDLLILDILMQGLNGIELAKEIRRENSNCKIVFLTSSSEFAVSSYQVAAFHYLLKPLDDSELHLLLNKALNDVAEEKTSSIVIKEKTKLTRVQIHTIEYIECIGHSIHFHLHNKEVLVCYGSLNEFQEALLSDSRFIQCHRSFILNMNYAVSITSKDFILKDNVLVPISKASIQTSEKHLYQLYF